MSNITLQQIRVFLSIMKTGTMSDAARELNRTQPAISASIRTLEDQLGFALFEKNGSKLIPTAEARYFENQGRAIIARLEETSNTLERFRKQQHGQLKVACLPSASQILIPDLLSSFLEARPGIHLSFLTRTSDTVVSWVSSQQIDVGLAETPREQSELYTQSDFRFHCVLACHQNSRLAKAKHLTPELLGQEKFIGLFPDHLLTRGLDEQLTREGFQLDQTVELQTTIPAFTFVSADLGFTVLDPLSARSYQLMRPDAPICYRSLPFELYYPLSILTPRYRDRSHLALAFREELERALRASEGLEDF